MNQRLIKECTLAAYEAARRAGWPTDFIERATVFYIDDMPAELEEDAMSALDSLDEFPYPDTQFIAIRQFDHSSSPVKDLPPAQWAAFDARMCDPAHVTLAADGLWPVLASRANMLYDYYPGYARGYPTRSYEGSLFKDFSNGEWKFACSRQCYDFELPQALALHRDWMGYPDHQPVTCLFHPLVVPTQYIVDARLPEFGPGPFRRRFRNKPICMHIKYERLYRLYEMAHPDEERAVAEPHGRHGHIRHYWRAAGVDKRFLPRSPKERLRLVQTRRVRRQYIHPTWVGEQKWTFDGVELEVRIGESDLPLLGSPTTKALRGRTCENCGATIEAVHLGIKDTDGRSICCHHCVLNPDGCRCRFGEAGVPQDGPLSQAAFSVP